MAMAAKTITKQDQTGECCFITDQKIHAQSRK